jgi:hypothetical protein
LQGRVSKKEVIHLVIHSEKSQEEYLQAIVNRMDSVTRFGEERFTGFRKGKFFYVIHHCGHEWDRRFTNPKNSAIGYAESAEQGCDIHFLKFKGLFCPSQFLLILAVFVLGGFLSFLLNSMGTFLDLPLYFAITTPGFLILCALETLFESMTERSMEGEDALLSLLHDPEDPFTYC